MVLKEAPAAPHLYVKYKSRFLARVSVVSSHEEAMSAVRAATAAEPKAGNHCWAYSLAVDSAAQQEDASGGEGTYCRYSDDGEPSGTAGRPILTAIEAEGLTNVVVVVSRYFGGRELGTGGLARAFVCTAREALQLLCPPSSSPSSSSTAAALKIPVVAMQTAHVAVHVEDTEHVYRSVSWVGSAAGGAHPPLTLTQPGVVDAEQRSVYCLQGTRAAVAAALARLRGTCKRSVLVAEGAGAGGGGGGSGE